MYDYLREGFNQLFHGMEDEYRAIIDAYRKTIKDLDQYVPEIAVKKAKAEKKEVRLKIEALKQKYWDSAIEYLDDETAELEKKRQNASYSGKIEDLMEILLLEKELPFMDTASIEQKFENVSEPIRRLIISHLRSSDNTNIKHLLISLNKTELDVIEELRGRIKQQQAYHNSVQTDAVLTHSIDEDLRSVYDTSPYFGIG